MAPSLVLTYVRGFLTKRSPRYSTSRAIWGFIKVDPSPVPYIKGIALLCSFVFTHFLHFNNYNFLIWALALMLLLQGLLLLRNIY